MSRTPEIPEHLKPLAPGYTPRQTQIDAEMVSLGRPVLSVRQALNTGLLRAFREQVEVWEHAHPTEAARWLELRAEARAEDLRLYEERYGSEAFTREQMRSAGFEDELVERAAKELRDSAMFTAARDWAADGTQWSLVLMGPPGCGKSQAATWAAFQLYTRNRFAPRCACCPKVSEQPLYDMTAEEYRWRCAQAGVLLLDDLGEGEQCNEKRHAWRAWVDDVLTQRHAARRKTIITTNRTVAELAAWLSPRIVDRLREGAVVSTNEASMRANRETTT